MRKKKTNQPQDDVTPINTSDAETIPDAVPANPIEEVAASPAEDLTAEFDQKPAPAPTVAEEGIECGQEATGVEPTGTQIARSGDAQDVPDVTVEEPTYPAHEWHSPAEPALVLPDEKATNEALIEGARRLVQIVGWRMRRTVQEWWLIGRHLMILKSRPENEGRWRNEILPQIGINHQSDYQLRTMAEEVTFEACLNYTNKSMLFRDIGVLPPNQTKQLGVPQAAAIGSGDPKIRVGIEDTFGLGSEATYELGGVQDSPFTQAAPFEDIPNQFGAEVEPLAGIVADEATHPTSVADPKSQPKADGKTHPQADAKKVAAKAAPQPEGDDPIAGTEALVITLSGAEIADMEAAAAESGLTLLVKTQDQIVGLLWYADDPHKVARERVGKALAVLRPVKKKFKVEARYLGVFDSIAV